ncbi:MAG: hypothetical protein KGZ92_10930 [Firmicutes bacterium]|nr:hypothetical protein [Bacillota bacterium]
MGRVRYNGRTFGPAGLTAGAIYYVLSVEEGMLRVVDDEEMGYLYDMADPGPFDDPSPTGKWELIEDYTGVLSRVLQQVAREN